MSSSRKDVAAPSRVGAQGDRQQQSSPTKSPSAIKPKVLTPKRVTSHGDRTQKPVLTKTSPEIKPKVFTPRKVGSLGDRRQITLTRTPSGVKPKIIKPLKRSPAKKDVDEEEWEKRMETWEKKKKRLSGSEWDKSFREAARGTLKGKKPWRVPISPYKAKHHKVGCESFSPEDENNSGSSTTELSSPEWENVDAFRIESEKQNYEQNLKQKEKEEEKMSFEAVDLKRETSKMLLDVTAVTQSGDTSRSAPSWLQRSLKISKKKANIKTPDTDEKTDDLPLTQTNSFTLANTDQALKSFEKSVLSPIQSVSEYSKVGVEVQNSYGQNVVEESANIKEKKSTGDTCSQHREQMDEPSTSEKLVNSDEPNHCKKDSKARQSATSELSSTKKFSDEYWIKVRSLLSDSSPLLPEASQNISDEMTSNASKQKNEEESVNSPGQTCHSSPQCNLPNSDIICPTNDEKKENKEESWGQQPYPETMYREKNRTRKASEKDLNEDVMGPTKHSMGTQNEMTKVADEVNSSCTEPHEHDHSSRESTLIKEINQKKKLDNVDNEEKRGSIDEKSKLKNGNEKSKAKNAYEKAKMKNVDEQAKVQNVEEKDNTMNDEEKAKVKNVDEKAKIKNDDGKSEIKYGLRTSVKAMKNHEQLATPIGSFPPGNTERRNAKSSLASRNSQLQIKESPTRASKALEHIVNLTLKKKGDRKPKETLWNSPSTTYHTRERSSLPAMFSCPDSELFGRRKKPPAQPVFIRTEARPSREKNQQRPEESLENLSSKRGMWYREFQNPEISSDEFDSDQALVKSNCYREIIIDRSGCRTLYEGPCQVTVTEGFDERNVRRRDLAHDTSRQSTNNVKNPKHLLPYAEYKNIRKRPSIESLCYTD